MITKEKIIYLIIDNIEGGYYHPEMKPLLKGGEEMKDSGETMYGIDRKAGAPLYTVGTPQAVQFWQIIDNNFSSHHSDTSYYNDKADGKKKIPAAVGNQLKPLAAAIIISGFEKNLRFLSEGAKKMVLNNPRLLLQFIYATYNGSGYFQTFANVMNAAYSNGERSAIAFWNLIQNKRRSYGGLYAKGANKLDALLDKVEDGGSSGGTGWLWWLLAGVGTFFLISKIAKK